MQYERLEDKPALGINLDRDEADLLWMACQERDNWRREVGYSSTPTDKYLLPKIPGDKAVRLELDVDFMRGASWALFEYARRTSDEVRSEYRPRENSQIALKLQGVVERVMDRAVSLTDRFSTKFRPGTETNVTVLQLGRWLTGSRRKAVTHLRPHLTSMAVMRFQNGRAATSLYEQFEAALAEIEEAQSA